jgi:leucine dehydrogenase
MYRLKDSLREHPDFSNHEELLCLFPPREFKVSEILIAIHNERLGPATGGTRVYPYTSWEEARTDALRLSSGMTRKIILADEIQGLTFDLNGEKARGLGGGKSVVIANPTAITEKFLMWYAEKLNSFKGRFITGEDMNFSMANIDYMYGYTRYVAGRSKHLNGGGDPSLMTALGVREGIKACLMFLHGSDSLEGRTFAVMGGRLLKNFSCGTRRNSTASKVDS